MTTEQPTENGQQIIKVLKNSRYNNYMRSYMNKRNKAKREGRAYNKKMEYNLILQDMNEAEADIAEFDNVLNKYDFNQNEETTAPPTFFNPNQRIQPPRMFSRNEQPTAQPPTFCNANQQTPPRFNSNFNANQRIQAKRDEWSPPRLPNNINSKQTPEMNNEDVINRDEILIINSGLGETIKLMLSLKPKLIPDTQQKIDITLNNIKPATTPKENIYYLIHLVNAYMTILNNDTQ
jgi:hypothetical protein